MLQKNNDKINKYTFIGLNFVGLSSQSTNIFDINKKSRYKFHNYKKINP